MFESSIKLGKIAGISIGINYSLFLIAGLLTYILTFSTFPLQAPGYAGEVYLFFGIVTALFFFASILWHELAHGLMAKFFHVKVKRIVLFFMGGIAEIEDEPHNPTQDFWISFVGPLSSLVLALIFGGISLLFPAGTISHEMFLWLAVINLILAAFNMLPGFPLDGGRVLRAILWWSTRNYLQSTRWASYLGQGIGYFSIMMGILAFLNPIFGGIDRGLWGVIMGIFLINSARSHLQSAVFRHNLKGIPLGTLVRRGPALEADWPLAYALDIMTMRGPQTVMPVTRDGQLAGILSIDILRALQHLHWAGITVGNVMRPIYGVRRVEASQDLYDVIRDVELQQEPYLLVTSNQQPLGLLSQREIFAHTERVSRG